MALKHRFVSAIPDGPDASKLRPSNWGSTSTDYDAAPTHVFDGGAHGSLLVRDTGVAEGSSWIAAAAGVLAASGVGQKPAFRALQASDIPQLDYASLANLPTLGDVASLNLGTLAGTVAEGNHLHAGVYEPVISVLDSLRGGTGFGSYVVGDLLYAGTTSTLAKLTAVATGRVLVSGGVGAAPAWSATPSLTDVTLSGRLFAANGTQGAPAITFTNDSDTGWYRDGTANRITMVLGGDEKVRYTTTGFALLNSVQLFIRDNAATIRMGLSDDVVLARDAANVFAQVNGANPQTQRWYASFTDTSNYTRGALSASLTAITLAAESGGTGTANMDVVLTPKGTGRVRFGSHAAIAAETITGYITVKDAGGTERKLAVVS